MCSEGELVGAEDMGRTAATSILLVVGAPLEPEPPPGRVFPHQTRVSGTTHCRSRTPRPPQIAASYCYTHDSIHIRCIPHAQKGLQNPTTPWKAMKE
jgi:hypothetical protein